jgi:hypothetical protein
MKQLMKTFLAASATSTTILMFLVTSPSAIPSFFETKESGGVQNRSEKNRIVVF